MSTSNLIGRLTVFTSQKPGMLGKAFKEVNGTLVKEAVGQMVRGRWRVETFADVEEAAALLQIIGQDEAISASVPTAATFAVVGDGVNGMLPQLLSGPVVTEAARTAHPGAVARTKHFFAPASDPALMMLDIDPPAAGPVPPLGAEAFNLLVTLCPGIAHAGVIGWLSGSSEIWRGEQQISGKKGGRLYVMVQSGADIARALKALNARAQLAGYGGVKVTANGSIRLAPLFDPAMCHASA